jgi:hypothetical protein
LDNGVPSAVHAPQAFDPAAVRTGNEPLPLISA